MSPPTVIERASDVVFQTLAGEEGAVLLHVGTGQYHTLNPVATRIWELLESPRTESELSRHLQGEFETGGESLEVDLRTFLQELSVRNLIHLDSNR
jgi:hypothetical protein